jgi:protein-tyrosine phosphatase
MQARTRWIELNGADNMRDLGGLPTIGGLTTRFGRMLRSDNLQGLTPADVRVLLGSLRLKNVIDLRSGSEVRLEGPGPLAQIAMVTIHHLPSYSKDEPKVHAAAHTGIHPKPPWQPSHKSNRKPSEEASASSHTRSAGHYLGYLTNHADSIIAALRVIARTDNGAAIVHCAAGKDRTGVVCAMALEAVGVTREAIVTDYAQTSERITAILTRLRTSDTYAAGLASPSADSHMPHPRIMEQFLSSIDEQFGGTFGWLAANGWSDADTTTLRHRLLD